MEGIPHPVPRTVEEVFQDFKGRRAGLIKALTTGTQFSPLPSSALLWSVDLRSIFFFHFLK